MNENFKELLGFMVIKTEMLSILKKEAEEAANTSKVLRDLFFSKQESKSSEDILDMIRIGTQVRLLAKKGQDIEKLSRSVLESSSCEELFSLLGPSTKEEEKVEA